MSEKSSLGLGMRLQASGLGLQASNAQENCDQAASPESEAQSLKPYFAVSTANLATVGQEF